jgi:hypothetical protein
MEGWVKAKITIRGGHHSIRKNAIQYTKKIVVYKSVEGERRVTETCVLARGVDPEVHSLGMRGRFP